MLIDFLCWTRLASIVMKRLMCVNIAMTKLNAVSIFSQFIVSMVFVTPSIHVLLMMQNQSKLFEYTWNNMIIPAFFTAFIFLDSELSLINITNYLKLIRNGHYFSLQNARQRSMYIRIWRTSVGIFSHMWFGSRILLQNYSFPWNKRTRLKMQSN